MKIGESLKEIKWTLASGNPDAGAGEVVYDSRKAVEDTVFVCMRGTRVDSHDFIPQALHQGCRVFVAEEKTLLLDCLVDPLELFMCVVSISF